RLDVRVTNRQNVVFRGLTEEQLPVLHDRLAGLGMAEPGAELARDVVACPGADTCNLAVTQSRGLADDIGKALEEAGLAEVGGALKDLDEFPTPDEAPDFYIDFDETGPFTGEVGAGECAGT